MQLQIFLEQYQKVPRFVVVQQGAGKFWGCEGFLLEFSQTCPRKNSDHRNKSSSCSFEHRWATFLLILSWVCSDFQVVCEGFQRFCPDFHGFSTNQNFWWCACTPTSYISGAA